MATQALRSFESTCGNKYPIVIQSWNNNWVNLSTYFDFSPEIRKIMVKWTSPSQNWSSTLA